MSQSCADVTVMMDLLLRALERLHAEGVSHGAVGPSTVLVPPTGINRGGLKLLGLGAFPSAGADGRQRDLRGVLWTGACALAGRFVDDESDAIGAVIDGVSRPHLAAWFRKHLSAQTLDAPVMRHELRVSRMADEAEAEPARARRRDLDRAMLAAEDHVDTWLGRVPPPRGLTQASAEVGEIGQAVALACAGAESLDSEIGVYLGMVRTLRDDYDRPYHRRGLLAVALCVICVVITPVIVLGTDPAALLRAAPKSTSTEPLLGPREPDDERPGPPRALPSTSRE